MFHPPLDLTDSPLASVLGYPQAFPPHPACPIRAFDDGDVEDDDFLDDDEDDDFEDDDLLEDEEDDDLFEDDEEDDDDLLDDDDD